ncbi:MAG: DUF642 domain-containing protein [Armatimonadota bacterium]
MRRIRIVCIVLAMAVMISCTAYASTNILKNGSFDDPVSENNWGSYCATVTDGITFGESWTAEGSINLVQAPYWQMPSSQCLDLVGENVGENVTYGVWQDVNTSAGQLYSLSFELAGNPNSGPPLKTAAVYWGGVWVKDLAFDTTGKSGDNMGWETVTISGLVGKANGTRLEFRNTNTASGNGGVALDNASLTAVPEPGTIFAALSILSPVGLVFRRRRA